MREGMDFILKQKKVISSFQQYRTLCVVFHVFRMEVNTFLTNNETFHHIVAQSLLTAFFSSQEQCMSWSCFTRVKQLCMCNFSLMCNEIKSHTLLIDLENNVAQPDLPPQTHVVDCPPLPHLLATNYRLCSNTVITQPCPTFFAAASSVFACSCKCCNVFTNYLREVEQIMSFLQPPVSSEFDVCLYTACIHSVICLGCSC